MRKIVFNMLALVMSAGAMAQNVQLHHDFGRNIYSDEEAGRPMTTLTFEQFSADRLGSWFYFVDLDMSSDGVVGAYTEVSREFGIDRRGGWAAHVEYNGGLAMTGAATAAVFQPAALVGGAWNGHNADCSATCSVQLLYKQFFKGCGETAYSSVQLTGVWGTTFAQGRLTCSGYIDLWRGRNAANGHGQLIVMTEPQLWYNVSKHISVGTEVEVSNNFVANFASDKTFFVNPTLAAKFNF